MTGNSGCHIKHKRKGVRDLHTQKAPAILNILLIPVLIHLFFFLQTVLQDFRHHRSAGKQDFIGLNKTTMLYKLFPRNIAH
jgi:hypothetical protein